MTREIACGYALYHLSVLHHFIQVKFESQGMIMPSVSTASTRYLLDCTGRTYVGPATQMKRHGKQCHPRESSIP